MHHGSVRTRQWNAAPVFRCWQCIAAAAFWFRVLLATVECGVAMSLNMKNLTKRVVIAYLLRRKQENILNSSSFSEHKKRGAVHNIIISELKYNDAKYFIYYRISKTLWEGWNNSQHLPPSRLATDWALPQHSLARTDSSVEMHIPPKQK